ncbi:diaminopropionate ammonia-lyase [Microbacterium sp. NPDC055357]
MSVDAYLNPAARRWRTDRSPDVLGFHASLPGYAPTRLVELPGIARELGVARVFVKEEASRLGLPAFKILGASYAVSRALTERVGDSGALAVDELRERLRATGPVRLVAATDGNHGRAVAHMARLLGIPARIYTPADITPEAKAGIESEGANRIEVDAPYDDVVAEAAESAGDADVLIQDTSWEGYERIPQWIVEGYTTLVVEADQQLSEAGARAEVVVVPVGVGSLAEAVVRHYRSGGTAPTVLSVEPTAAPTLRESLRAGRPVTVEASSTIMAGLNCGTPTAGGWPTLHRGIDAAVTVTDAATARAVHDLEALGIDAGPCGAATLAGIRSLAEVAPLAPEATVLLLSTESRAANPLPTDLS